jgi:WhiB family redox-sensing transcriptional regulator
MTVRLSGSSKWRPSVMPTPTFDAWSWQREGRCLGYSLDVFFPDDVRGRSLARREEIAKRICQSCPVLARCREYAVNAPEPYGIWGALTPRERQQVRTGH